MQDRSPSCRTHQARKCRLAAQQPFRQRPLRRNRRVRPLIVLLRLVGKGQPGWTSSYRTPSLGADKLRIGCRLASPRLAAGCSQQAAAALVPHAHTPCLCARTVGSVSAPGNELLSCMAAPYRPPAPHAYACSHGFRCKCALQNRQGRCQSASQVEKTQSPATGKKLATEKTLAIHPVTLLYW